MNMSDMQCRCGSRDWVDAELAGTRAVKQLKKFKELRTKQEVRTRLGRLGEGAFGHPSFRSRFVSIAISIIVAGLIASAIRGTFGLTSGATILLLSPVLASIMAFATVSHEVQKEVQAESDSLAREKRACRACGELAP